MPFSAYLWGQNKFSIKPFLVKSGLPLVPQDQSHEFIQETSLNSELIIFYLLAQITAFSPINHLGVTSSVKYFQIVISLLKYILTYLHPNLKKVTSLQIIKLDQRLFEKIINFLTTIKSDFSFFIKLKGFDSSDLPNENDYVNATF